jgi:methionyl-tRNA formyltransferase
MTIPARIIFAGSPEFAVPPLQTLIDSDHEIVAVLTQPDRPSGRGKKIVPGPVKQAALDAGLEILQPETLRDTEIQQALTGINADLMIVVAYGLLLPPEVLSIPKQGCINLHASLLPRWRGASPMQMAILHGDDKTGVCIMQMDAGLDTGPVLASASIDIGPRENIFSLHDRLAFLGAALLEQHLDEILLGELVATAQPDDGVTHAARIRKQDGLIDWSRSAIDIDRQIRAYAGWPVAYTTMNGESLRCWAGDIGAGADGRQQPGKVLRADKQGLHVQTGDGVLVLTSVQLAGRKQVSGSDFANAHAPAGLTLGT